MYLRGLLGTLVPAVLAGALVAVPQAAQASVGVGIQAGRSAVRAHPGQSVALPSVSVVNAGTRPESVRVMVQRYPRGGGRPVPPSWVRPGVPSVRLAPHHAIRIPLELVVPAGAKPGAYLSDIVAIASGQLSADGANLGAGAATLLEFRVAPDPAPGFWWSVFTQTVWALPLRDPALGRGVRRAQVRAPHPGGARGGRYGTADEYGGWHA